MEGYLFIALLTFLGFLAVLGFKYDSRVIFIAGLLKKFFDFLIVTINFWNIKVRVGPVSVARNYLEVISTFKTHWDRDTYEQVISNFVADNVSRLIDYNDTNSITISKSFYKLLESNSVVKNLISKILTKRYSDINVKRATILAINVLSDFYDLRNDLDKTQYQVLVVGINKILILIRDEEFSQKSIKEITSILYRVYKVTKAYKTLKKPITQRELYENISNIVGIFSN